MRKLINIIILCYLFLEILTSCSNSQKLVSNDSEKSKNKFDIEKDNIQELNSEKNNNTFGQPINSTKIEQYENQNLHLLSQFVSLENCNKYLYFKLNETNFKKIFLHSVNSSSTEKGNVFYSSDLVLFSELDIELNDSGLKLLVNSGNDDIKKVFLAYLSYEWPILGYVRDFDIVEFDNSIKAFYLLFFKMVNANSDDILGSIISNFFEWSKDDISPTELFVIDFNKKAMNMVKPFKKLTIIPSDYTNEIIDDLILQIESNNFDLKDILFTLYIEPLSEELAKDKLSQIFRSFLNEFSFETVQEMLIPYINFTVKSTNLSLQFPRKILKPIDDLTGEPFVHENKFSHLKFFAENIEYSSLSGFNFFKSYDFHFDRSEILNTGLSLSFTKAKIDIYENLDKFKNNSDYQPLCFKGVFVDSAFLELPSFWKFENTQNDMIQIVSTDLVIESPKGTFGNFKLVGGTLETRLPGNIKFFLNEFNFKIHQDTVNHLSIKGDLEIKNENGNHKIEVEGGFSEEEYVFFRKGTKEVVLKFPNKLSSNKLVNKIFVQISTSEFWFVDLND